MIDWSDFPAYVIEPGTALFRIHQRAYHPAWFNHDGTYRFDPPPSHRNRFGSCYLGREPLTSYVEIFGRFKAVPQVEIDRRVLSQINVQVSMRCGDLTNRMVLGRFGLDAAISTGTNYQPAQEVAAQLYAVGFDGIRYRVRHDPAMSLEAIALCSSRPQNWSHYN